MKRLIGLLSIFAICMIGCTKPEIKLVGKWTSPTVKGFVAEFNANHTGMTSVAGEGHGGAMSAELTKLPFKWEIAKDGTIKITEDKTVYLGKFTGSNKLELEVNGAKTVLEKTK